MLCTIMTEGQVKVIYMSTSTYDKKAFNKTQHSFMKEKKTHTLNTLGIDRTDSQHNKAIKDKPTAILYLTEKG